MQDAAMTATKTAAKRSLIAVLALAFLWAAAFPCRGEENPEELILQVRSALDHEGLRQWETGLHVEGEGMASGLDSRFTFHLLADGRFRMDTVSRLGGTSGFDGRQGWEIDYSGMPYPLDFWEIEVAKMIAWVMGGHWLDPGCPLQIQLSSGTGESGCLQLAADFPEGVVDAIIHIDGATYLPRKLTWMIFAEENSLEMMDYRDVNGFLFPHHIILTEGGEVVDIRVKSVREATAASAEACRPVTQRPADTIFSKDIPATIKLKRSSMGQLLVLPVVDGKETGWFTLDTGAGINVIDKGYAEEAGMEKLGKCTALGVGGRVDIGYCKGGVLSLGPVEIRDPVYYEIDFSPSSQYRSHEKGGILGYGFFSRCLAEIDIKENTLTLAEPGAWDGREAAWQEILFHDHLPAIRCTLSGGLEGIFALDSGADTTVTFSKRFVEQNNLLEGRKVQKVSLGGVGGTIPCFWGPVDWFEMAGHRFEKPNVLFAGADQGVFADKVAAGIIGCGFLEHFKLLIDYPNQRIGFIEKD